MSKIKSNLMVWLFIFTIIAAASLLLSQRLRIVHKHDVFNPTFEGMRFLIGTWEGEMENLVEEDLGKGKARMSFEFFPGGHFIVMKQTIDFRIIYGDWPIQFLPSKHDKNIHTDELIGFIGLDSTRQLYTARVYTSAGAAIDYRIEVKNKGRMLELISEGKAERIRYRMAFSHLDDKSLELTETVGDSEIPVLRGRFTKVSDSK